jgi:hypothetical protein
MKLLLIWILASQAMTWDSAVERRDLLTFNLPLAKNIGGEWIRQGRRTPRGPLWFQVLRSTNFYLVSQPVQQRDEARQTGWKSYQNSHYGIGLQWKLSF